MLESILAWDTLPASISPALVEKLMRIADRGDDSIAVAVGRLLWRKARETRADVLGGINRVRDYVESGTLRQQIAGLMVIKTCVESERLPGFTDAALAVLRTSQSSEARDAALSILQRAPDAERPQVLSALREGPEAITIGLIDSVTYWSPDDPRATVAIRERLYDPNSSDAVKKAAFAALKQLNALGPSDSLPSGLWRSP